MFKFWAKFSWDVLIIANLANFDEGGKTGLEGGKNIDPFLNHITKIVHKNTLFTIGKRAFSNLFVFF
jgi:hypothetical protein